MLIVLAVLGTLSACVIASLNYTAVVSRNVMRSNAQRTATEVADGAMDYAFAHWREICRQQTNTQRPTADFSSIPLPTQTLFPGVDNFTANTGANPTSGTPYTVANYKIEAVDPQLTSLASTTTAPPPSRGRRQDQPRRPPAYRRCREGFSAPPLPPCAAPSRGRGSPWQRRRSDNAWR